MVGLPLVWGGCTLGFVGWYRWWCRRLRGWVLVFAGWVLGMGLGSSLVFGNGFDFLSLDACGGFPG